MFQGQTDCDTITAIYDRDHGSDSEGWYVRFRLADGREIDSIAFDHDDAEIDPAAICDMIVDAARWEGVQLPVDWRALVDVHR